MKNEKIHDTFNQVLHQYKLKEPVDVEKYLYLKKRERAMYKNILKQAGRYSFWMGIVYAFMQLLPRLGIKATFVKAVVALTAAVSVGTFAVYQGVSAVISTVTSSKGKTEFNGTGVVPVRPQVAAKSFVVTKPKEKQVTSTLPQKRKKKTLHPDIGIFELESFVPGIKTGKVTQQFYSLLPEAKYTLIHKGRGGYGTYKHLTEINLSLEKNEYVLRVKVTNMKDGRYIHIKAYRFTDLDKLNSIIRKAARDLIKTKL